MSRWFRSETRRHFQHLIGLPGTEAAYREAIAADDPDAWNDLDLLLSEQRGRRHDAEAAYRQAIVAGIDDAWFNLGLLLSRQDEAIAAFRAAIVARRSPRWRRPARPRP